MSAQLEKNACIDDHQISRIDLVCLEEETFYDNVSLFLAILFATHFFSHSFVR